MSFLKRPSENYCPGISDYVRPKVDYDKCPKCGGRLELWSDEEKGACLDCGEITKKEEPTPSCLDYCEYADKCKGIIMAKKQRLPKNEL